MSDDRADEERRLIEAARAMCPNHQHRTVLNIAVYAQFEGDAEGDTMVGTGFRVRNGPTEIVHIGATLVEKINLTLREQEVPISLSLTMHSHKDGDRMIVVDGPKEALEND